MTQEASGDECFYSQQQLLRQQLYRRDHKFQTFFIGKISPKSETKYQKIRKWSVFVGFSCHK
jgi:hypothetical protein